MIWLTWRQFRIQAVTAAAAIAVVAVALLITGPALFEAYRSSGFAACTAACGDLSAAFVAEAMHAADTVLYVGGTGLLFALPLVVGMFWGAPLVARELESGTHRLVWNQTVSRGRWLAVKLIGVGLAAVLTAGLLSLAVTWWSGPFDEATGGRLLPMFFSARGVVPMGYAALAFVVGVVVGMVTRRPVLAMAVTLVLVVLVMAFVPFTARELLATTTTSTAAFDRDRIGELHIGQHNEIMVQLEAPVANAWVLSNQTLGRDGRVYAGPVDETACGRAAGGPKSCEEWLAQQGLTQKITYVPAGQFWTLQWRELALLFVTTGLLSAFCVWWVRRRVT